MTSQGTIRIAISVLLLTTILGEGVAAQGFIRSRHCHQILRGLGFYGTGEFVETLNRDEAVESLAALRKRAVPIELPADSLRNLPEYDISPRPPRFLSLSSRRALLDGEKGKLRRSLGDLISDLSVPQGSGDSESENLTVRAFKIVGSENIRALRERAETRPHENASALGLLLSVSLTNFWISLVGNVFEASNIHPALMSIPAGWYSYRAIRSFFDSGVLGVKGFPLLATVPIPGTWQFQVFEAIAPKLDSSDHAFEATQIEGDPLQRMVSLAISGRTFPKHQDVKVALWMVNAENQEPQLNIVVQFKDAEREKLGNPAHRDGVPFISSEEMSRYFEDPGTLGLNRAIVIDRGTGWGTAKLKRQVIANRNDGSQGIETLNLVFQRTKLLDGADSIFEVRRAISHLSGRPLLDSVDLERSMDQNRLKVVELTDEDHENLMRFLEKGFTSEGADPWEAYKILQFDHRVANDGRARPARRVLAGVAGIALFALPIVPFIDSKDGVRKISPLGWVSSIGKQQEWSVVRADADYPYVAALRNSRIARDSAGSRRDIWAIDSNGSLELDFSKAYLKFVKSLLADDKREALIEHFATHGVLGLIDPVLIRRVSPQLIGNESDELFVLLGHSFRYSAESQRDLAFLLLSDPRLVESANWKVLRQSFELSRKESWVDDALIRLALERPDLEFRFLGEAR